MLSHEVSKYYDSAVEKVLGKCPITIDDIEEFEKFLGLDIWAKYIVNPSHLDLPLTADERRLLAMLTGPHSATIVRMIRIQKGLIKDETC
jgi:hypothetical protein